MKTGALIFYTALAVFIGILLYGYNYSRSSPYMISGEKAKNLIRQKKIDIVLDVRTKAERDVFGYYPGSIHIPAGDLDQQFLRSYPNKDVSILVYCNTGQRARAATEKLKSFGFKNVHYIPTSHLSLM